MTLSVLHISTETGWRGGEQQVKLLTDGLVARGHRCRVMSPPGAALFADRQKAGIGVPLRIRLGEWDFWAVKQIILAAREMGAQILHAQTSHAHGLAVRAAKELKLPLVVSRRVDFPVGGNWLSRKKYLSPRVRYIAISNAVKQVLTESGVEPWRISVAHSGVDPNGFPLRGDSRDDTLAAKWGANADTPLLVNAAALTDHKDQATLLRAAAILRDRSIAFRLVVAGSGELEGVLKQLCGELRLQNHVHFAGYLNDVGELYRAADAFVLSSHLEGLCTSILDAMSVGLPVVATRTGGVPEIVRHGVNGLLAAPRDPESLANNIQRLIAQPELAGQFSQAGRETVLSRFTNDHMVDGTIQAYQSVLRSA